MELHNKQEMKEQLTEHLYTIIHQNEVRKAKKLAELMKTLEMENETEEEVSLPELPPLTSFQPPNNLLSPTSGKHSYPHISQESHSNTVEPQSDSQSAKTSIENSTETHSPADVDYGVTIPVKSEPVNSNSCEGQNVSENLDKSVTALTENETQPIEKETEKISTHSVDNTGNAIDLSIVKTEVLEKEECFKNPHVKTAWDFDGSVK